MEDSTRMILIPALTGLLLVSCGTSRQATNVDDDIYYAPSKALAEVPTRTKGKDTPKEEVVVPQVKDDYYDAGTAQQYVQPRGFYDMTYNDPYYYNYGRFGFNSGYGTGLAFQTGWFMGPGGYASRWGYGTGVHSGWFRPGISIGLNYGYPFGGGWNQFAWYNDPYYMGWGGGYGYGSGYGYGNYYGPYGNCPWYAPVVIGGTSNLVVGHRPSIGSRTGSNSPAGTVGSTRSQTRFRDPIGLMPSVDRSTGRSVSTNPNIREGSRGVVERSSGTSPVLERGNRPSTGGRQPAVTQPRSVEGRGALGGRSGSPERGTSSPSRSGGGGTRPSMPNRVR